MREWQLGGSQLAGLYGTQGLASKGPYYVLTPGPLSFPLILSPSLFLVLSSETGLQCNFTSVHFYWIIRGKTSCSTFPRIRTRARGCGSNCAAGLAREQPELKAQNRSYFPFFVPRASSSGPLFRFFVFRCPNECEGARKSRTRRRLGEFDGVARVRSLFISKRDGKGVRESRP